MPTATPLSLHPATPTVADVLVARGALTPADRERVETLSRETGGSVGAALLRSGLIAEAVLADAYAQALGLPRFDTAPTGPIVSHPALSPAFLAAARIAPIADHADHLVLAAFDPEDTFALQATALAIGKRIEVHVATASQITSLLADATAPATRGDGVALGTDEPALSTDKLRDLASDAPIVRAVQRLVQRGIEDRASDIHIEPVGETFQVRYRIDGVLRIAEPALPPGTGTAIGSRLKLLAGLDITERRLPQDGRLRLPFHGRVIDFRVSTVPTLEAESLVIRILDRSALTTDFTALGFTPAQQRALHDAMRRPHGIILVTGPTGSGKTTTLYAMLHALNVPERKILTVEDPVEYQITGVNQIPIRPSIGLHFADALRSVVRQDPDVIMVGEMRDVETARIAIQAALTGHLVLSTLHTNEAPGAVTRLLDMGIEPYLITSTVTGILAQRLVRRLCEHCRVPAEGNVPPLVIGDSDLPPDAQPCTPRGCARCGGTGYHGRLVIAQWLALSDPVRAAILRHADSTEIARLATADGMQTLRADGMLKVATGLTSLDDVLRVTL